MQEQAPTLQEGANAMSRQQESASLNFDLGRMEDNVQEIRNERAFVSTIVVVLPQEIPQGETFELTLSWSASLPFANLNRVEQGDRISLFSSGTTTGIRRYLPRVLPFRKDAAWEFLTTVHAPISYGLFRKQKVVTSGNSIRSWKENSSPQCQQT